LVLFLLRSLSKFSVNCFTLISVPSAPPIQCSGTNTSSTSFKIKWTKIALPDREGVILGYKIKFDYMDFEGFDYRFGNLTGIHDCIGEEVEECEISELSLFTNYTVQVAGYTSAGDGPWSSIFYVKTSPFGRFLI